MLEQEDNEEIRKRFYALIVSQLMYDKYETEATTIQVFEETGPNCDPSDQLLKLVKPHLVGTSNPDTDKNKCAIRSRKRRKSQVVNRDRKKNTDKALTTKGRCRDHTEGKERRDVKVETSARAEDNETEITVRVESSEILEEKSDKTNDENVQINVTGSDSVPSKISGLDSKFDTVVKTGPDELPEDRGNKLKITTCNICQLVFNSSSSLYRHISDEHMTVTAMGCICKICNKTLKHQYSLHNHLKTHSDVKNILCDDCGECFKRSTDYIDHRQKAHENNTYECPHCEQKYRLKRSLQKHIGEVHRNPGRHVCEMCGKRFNSSAKLRMHMMVYHTKEKPHKCKICGISFRGTGHLQNHMLLHTGVKRFKCGLCNHRVYQRGNMKSHMKVHTKETNNTVFWCTDCKQGWPKKSELQNHACAGEEDLKPLYMNKSNSSAIERSNRDMTVITPICVLESEQIKLPPTNYDTIKKEIEAGETRGSGTQEILDIQEAIEENINTSPNNVRILKPDSALDSEETKTTVQHSASETVASEPFTSSGETHVVVQYNGNEHRLIVSGDTSEVNIAEVIKRLAESGNL